MTVTIRVFDPAMCCSTGICGPSVDPELVRFAADVDWLVQQGVAVERFNLSQQPGAFATTPVVKEALERGTEVLPLILVGDRIAVEGAYPSRDTLAALAGVVVKKVAAPAASGCCGGARARAAAATSSASPDPEAGPKSGCC
ncbi:MAG: arsenite efflux transporter metallochaperone ArsD [Kofleriaceae bacterium]|nr:arsenite efflux transporter metallochaperone ArsD [Myxococcales bacterium]MCB9564754.1 arsenite efflux transporter metallochaperone ArsD [Kofleriaceae bacterium]MCB9572803.1 arsenite efflux transporter metallochaperone ArsD [Kofleriaceae bacterium]